MSHGHDEEKMIKLGKNKYSEDILCNYSTCHNVVKEFIKAGLPSEDGEGTENMNYFIAKHISEKEKIDVPTVNIFSLGISIIVFFGFTLLVLFQLALINQHMTSAILSKLNLTIVNFDLLLIMLSVAFGAISIYLLMLISKKLLSKKGLAKTRDCHNNIVLALQTIKVNQK